MGNIILSNSFVDVSNANITARSEASGYPKLNTMDRIHALRPFRADDVTTDDYLLKFNFGAAQSLDAILINHVNFDEVAIQGNATDSWTSPSYDGSDLDISQNKWTGRYQIYIPLTSFNYQYLRIYIPPTASAVGDYTTKWQVGTVCFLSSITTLTKNMSYGYKRSADIAGDTINLPYGGQELVEKGDDYKFSCSLVFDRRRESEESELLTVNRMNRNRPIVFYENRGETQDAWLMKRDTAYSGTISSYNVVTGTAMRFTEQI